jgi:hypothetical protein
MMALQSLATLSVCLLGSTHAFSGASMNAFAMVPSKGGMRSESMGALSNNCAAGTVDLGTAGDFTILAKTGITNVATSVVTGNMGVSPIAAEAITGFSLVAHKSNTYAVSAQVNGQIFAANYVSPTPVELTTAIGDMETAFTDAASRDTTTLNLLSGLIGGATMNAGVYTFDTDVKFDSQIFLSGNQCDVIIIQTTGNVVVGSDVSVILQGGLKAENIFWQVAGEVIVGTNSHMEGTLISKTGVTLKTGSSLNGRILAQTNAVLQMATVTGF